VACVPKGLLEPFSMPASVLADTHLFSLRPDEMEQIDLGSDGKHIELVRAGSGWHIREPTDSVVDGEVGQAFARALRDMTCDDIVDPSTVDAAGTGLKASAPPEASGTWAAITRVGGPSVTATASDEQRDGALDAGRWGESARERVHIGQRSADQ